MSLYVSDVVAVPRPTESKICPSDARIGTRNIVLPRVDGARRGASWSVGAATKLTTGSPRLSLLVKRTPFSFSARSSATSSPPLSTRRSRRSTVFERRLASIRGIERSRPRGAARDGSLFDASAFSSGFRGFVRNRFRSQFARRWCCRASLRLPCLFNIE